MFPPKQLLAMVQHSNTQLDADTFAKTNTSEILEFFGVIILTTKFELTSRRSLWNTVATSKYWPAPHLGQTGMSKTRFEELFKWEGIEHNDITTNLSHQVGSRRPPYIPATQ